MKARLYELWELFEIFTAIPRYVAYPYFVYLLFGDYDKVLCFMGLADSDRTQAEIVGAVVAFFGAAAFSRPARERFFYFAEALVAIACALTLAQVLLYIGPYIFNTVLRLDESTARLLCWFTGISSVIMVVGAIVGYVKGPQVPNVFAILLRGVPKGSYEAAREIYDRRLGKSEDWFPFGGLRVPFKDLLFGVLAIGGPGTGKSVCLIAILTKIAHRFFKCDGVGLVWFDVKGTALQILAAMPGVNMDLVLYMNPFDTRTCVWDLCRDVWDEITSFALAVILIPKPKESKNEFFYDAARILLAEVLNVFRLLANHYDLRDIVIALSSPQNLRLVLTCTESGREALATYCHSAEVFQSVFMTANNAIRPLRPIAAHWHRVPKSLTHRFVSLVDWCSSKKRRGALVFRADPALEDTGLTLINNAMFAVLSKATLKGPDVPDVSTVFQCDELNRLSDLPGVGLYLAESRSKGTAALLGAQTKNTLELCLGEKEASSVLGLLKFLVAFRTEDHDTAVFLQNRLGSSEVLRTIRDTAYGKDGETESDRTSVDQDFPFIDGEFKAIPMPDEFGGMHGVYGIPHADPYYAILFKEYLDEMVARPNLKVARDMPWPPEADFLPSWNPQDLERLGIAPKQESDAEQPDLPGLDSQDEGVDGESGSSNEGPRWKFISGPDDWPDGDTAA